MGSTEELRKRSRAGRRSNTELDFRQQQPTGANRPEKGIQARQPLCRHHPPASPIPVCEIGPPARQPVAPLLCWSCDMTGGRQTYHPCRVLLFLFLPCSAFRLYDLVFIFLATLLPSLFPSPLFSIQLGPQSHSSRLHWCAIFIVFLPSPDICATQSFPPPPP